MDHPTIECCEVNDVDRAFGTVWSRLRAQHGSQARYHHIECPQAQALRRRRNTAGLFICVRFEEVHNPILMSVVLIVGPGARVYWVSAIHDLLNEHPNICDDLVHAGLAASGIERHEPPSRGVARLYPRSHSLSPLYMDVLSIFDNHCPYLTRRQHVHDVLAEIDRLDQASNTTARAPTTPAAPAAPNAPAAGAPDNAGVSPCPPTYPQNFAALLVPLKPVGQDTYAKSIALRARNDYQTLSPPDKLIAFYSGFESTRTYSRAKDKFFIAFAAEVLAGGPMSSINNSINEWARMIARDYSYRHVRNGDGVIMIQCFEAMGWLDPNLYNGTAAQAAGNNNTNSAGTQGPNVTGAQ